MLVQFPVQRLLFFQPKVLILKEVEVKIVVSPFSTPYQTTVVGKVSVEMDTCIVITAIPLCREYVGYLLALLTAQELYGTFREETPVKDENLPFNIKFIDRVIQRFYILHTARKRANHCRQSRVCTAQESEIDLRYLYLILVVALLRLIDAHRA